MKYLRHLVIDQDMCSLPWLHAEINLQNNLVQPCCKFKGSLGNVHDNFTDTWYNKEFTQLRKDMVSNNHIDACSACHVPKDVFSYKKWKNKLYTHMMSVDVDSPILPKVFHFGLKNTCNLACRMCNPGLSSKLDQLTKKSNILQKYFPIQVTDNKFNIENLRGSFSNAEHVTFAGGEPTIDDDCLALIKIIKQESTKLRSVNFSTNMTRLNHELLQELSDLPGKVMLSVSIDGPPKIHEYIRYKCNWNEIIDNLMCIRKQYPKILLSINTTVSVLNVGYVVESLDLFHNLEDMLEIKMHHLMISPVIDKEFLHPSILPDSTKALYLEKLSNYTGKCTIPESGNLIPTAIKMLSESPRSSMDNFKEYISEFDKIAGTDYKLLYPEFKLT